MTPYVRIFKDKLLYEGFLQHIPKKGEVVTIDKISGTVSMIFWKMPKFIGHAVDPNRRFEVDIYLKD